MSSLRSAAPRPSTTRVAPAYPRLLAPRLIAMSVLVLAGCGGAVESQETTSPESRIARPSPTTETSPNPAGGEPAPFDAGAPDTGPADAGPPDTGADTGPDALPFPEPAGDIAYPYDAGPFDAGAGDV